MSRNYHKPHDYNAICDVCGFKYKASELKRRWDGLMVCSYDYEPRPAQEFIRGIKETVRLPFSKPEATDVFVQVGNRDSYAVNTHRLNTHRLG